MSKKTRSDTHHKLKFSEKLVGKGHSTDALLKKIKTLHLELSELDQDLVDTKSLSAVRKELISPSILLHKDKGVKAYAACCMADLLRLYAPDAPYTGPELKDMFQFFFRQLATGLKGTESPYYSEYFYLLESLSTIKSVVLVCDLPQADELMSEIFRTFFDLVRQEMPKNVELFMSDILVAIIEESVSIPSEVLDSILGQFTGKNAHVEQPSYRLAVDVCNATADRLQRNVCQYFTETILRHGEDEDLDEISTAHDLIKQLNRACPSLLLNVVPQLEEELRVDELQIRLMATQVLGEMFSDKRGAELAKKYPTTWQTWLVRKNDKAPAVRVAFVEGSVNLLKNHPSLRVEIEEALHSKILDPDDKVRASACKVYGQIDYETALHHVSVSQLKELCSRFLDKKAIVRTEAFAAIGNLYRLAFPEIDNGDAATIEQFAWIPQEILQTFGVSGDARPIAEQAIAEYVLSLSSKTPDEVAWTERLLTVVEHLDGKGVHNLLTMTSLKSPRPLYYEKFIDCCIENNGGIIDENEEQVTRKLEMLIQSLSRTTVDPSKAAEDLHTFAKLNEARLYKLLKTCMDPQTDLSTLVKSTTDFLKRLEAASPTMVDTLTSIIRSSTLWIVNQSSIPTMIKRLQLLKGNTVEAQTFADKLSIIFATISKCCPPILKPHVHEFYKALNDTQNPRLVEVALQAMASVARADKSVKPSDSTIRKCKAFVKGSNRRHSKFAARLLAHIKDSKEICEELVEDLWTKLRNAPDDHLVANLAALAEFATCPPESFDIPSEVMIQSLLDMLGVADEKDDAAMETEEDWSDDVSTGTQAKILMIKVCTNRCLALRSTESAAAITTPVIRMLFTILELNGLTKPDAQDDPKSKSRLRLQAAISLLHLSSVLEYCRMITANFILLALTMQDTCYQVRRAFLDKLTHYLLQRKLDPLFNVIAFLTPHDPEQDIRDKAKNYVQLSFRRSSPEVKVSNFEMIFIRLLHLLAHHPDFAKTSETLEETAKYIQFYLGIIGSADNVSLLYHLALKAKTVRDAESHTYSENLYMVGELAQHVIKAHANEHSWPLTSYPGKIKLPADIFRALPNPEAASKILKTTYLPIDNLTWLAQTGKQAAVKKERPKAPVKSPKKRKALTSKTNGQIKRPRKVRRKNDDSEDEKESAPSETEDENGMVKSEVEEEDQSTADEGKSEDDDGTEHLGRGARSKVKARLKKEEKKKRPRPKPRVAVKKVEE